ncbi:MAG: response regulator [Leptospirillia bacterium]
MNRILLLDDEENILRALRRAISSQDYVVEDFTDPNAALARSEVAVFSLVVSDYRMPNMDGVHFLRRFKEQQPDAPRILLSGQTDREGLLKAINQAEIYRFISKPWDDYELRVTIRQALAQREMSMENDRLANQVRRQQRDLDKQDRLLDRLEKEYPGIGQVRRAEDGSVIIDD